MPAGPNDPSIQARCGLCGVIVSVADSREEVVPQVLAHLMDRGGNAHGLREQQLSFVLVGDKLIKEGGSAHWRIEPVPPFRCDLCGLMVEPPWWCWVTPSKPDYPVEDPDWLVCDNCHPFVDRQDVAGLSARIWDVTVMEFAYADESVRKEDIRYTVLGFLAHVDRSLTRRETQPAR